MMRRFAPTIAALYLFVALVEFGFVCNARIAEICGLPFVNDAPRCQRSLKANGALTLLGAAAWPVIYVERGVVSLRQAARDVSGKEEGQ